ncbi:MAG: desulfoferrodoxin FeS4 iron-binding domain-containing protein [Promethearchaeota archaeon]
MAQVQAVGERYRCDVCGNEIEVTSAGGGELRCCARPMRRIGR